MTPPEVHPALRRLLVRKHQSVLHAWSARFSLLGVAIGAAIIAGAVILGAFLPGGESAAWVRLVAVVVLCAAAIGFAVVRTIRSSDRFDSYLERVEQRFPEVRSWLRNALDFQSRPPDHSSVELAGAVSQETARRLAAVPLDALKPGLAARRPMLVLALSLLSMVGLGLGFPDRISRSWNTLWNPALAAPPIRLVVEPGSVEITPGAALSVRARVWGTTRRPQLIRENESDPTATAEGPGQDGARLWRFDLTQLTREQEYRVRVGGVQSPRYLIALAGEPVPVGFQIEYRSPAYARLPVQRGAATRGDLSALQGTRAHVEVTFDRDLEKLDAHLPGGATATWNSITARRWKGEITLDREGEYELVARAASGEGRARYRITPLPDAPPVIAVQLPSGDLDLPAGQQVPLEILGQDDLGLSELRLQVRKDAASAWTDLPLSQFAGRPREATIRSRWDASSLALLPGQTATFRFVLFDDNAVTGRGRAVSPSFELRFPSLADLYEKVDATQGGVQNTLEKVAEQARELQKSLDKLARQQPARSTESQSNFERSEELKNAMQRQQQLTGKLDEATRQLQETLDQAAEREAFNQELTRKIKEMTELMRQVQSHEFKEAVRRMEQAMENMDRRAMEQSLPELRTENKEMLQGLERTIELLKQIRTEEKLQALAKRAEELQRQQDALNREHQAQEDAQNERKAQTLERERQRQALAEQQQRAAEQTEKLAQDARELQSELDRPEADQELEKSADELEQNAAKEQKDASQQISAGQPKQARQRGQKASESLESAAQRMQNLMNSMQQEREGADLAAIRRAAQDLVSLQREAESNLGSNSPNGERANTQTDLSEGVSRIADSLQTLAQKSPFISPKLSESLGKAISGLSNSGREMGNGNRQRGEELGRSGGAALNQAVLELREAESSMCQNPGPSGDPKKKGNSTQRMGELGERQSQLNSESRTLAQRLTQQMRLSSGDRDQLQRLSQEQGRLREQLEQIQKDDETRRELLGRLDATKRDMKEVEELLESGDTSGQLEEKQQRILSRLLDAQRSINRRDFDPERESRAGEDLARQSAPDLSQELLRETDRLRLDLLKSETDRYPAQYRTFVEAYLRRLNGSRR